MRVFIACVLLATHLLAREALCRPPRVPLTRHRDVVTSQGTVRGYYTPKPPHYTYLGIPYARPPTRYNRFKAPEAPVAWDGIFEATHRVKCPQPDGTGDENCLIINVFSPEYAKSLPVVMFFHGGGFNRGWGFYNAPVRLLQQDIIVVTFNYRLGALGFLSLNSPDIPGNAGLKDQVAALYWVHMNIAKFGGNPLDITVYGTGSGAASIELLILADQSNIFFHKAILESGTALSPSSLTYETKSVAYSFAQLIGYNGDNNINNLQEFFYTAAAKKLSNISRIFLPCIETGYKYSLIDNDPWAIIRSRKYFHISILITYSIAEEVSMITDRIFNSNTIPENFEKFIPNNLEFDSESNKYKIAKFIKDYYFENNNMHNNQIQNYIDYVNDVFLHFPTVTSSVYHAFRNSKPVFLMKFFHEGNLREKKYKNFKGAGHDDILQYIITNKNLGEDDEKVAKKLIDLLNNFIKLGDPTPITTSSIPTIWQPIVTRSSDGRPELRNVPYLKFSKIIINLELNNVKLILWDTIYNKFHKSNSNNSILS